MWYPTCRAQCRNEMKVDMPSASLCYHDALAVILALVVLEDQTCCIRRTAQEQRLSQLPLSRMKGCQVCEGGCMPLFI